MRKIIHIIERVDGVETEHTGKYIRGYDPTFHLGSEYDGGLLVTTDDPAQALQLPDALAAANLWQSTPRCSCHSTRPDGKPNRPLTIYTVAIENALASK